MPRGTAPACHAAPDRADPEDVWALLRPYHARLRREIERFGGTLDKFIGDGVMAVFGAPSTHEDDPERHGQALLGLGRCATRLGRPPAREPLLQARQIFARLGAGELLAETDGWLDGRGGPGGMVGRP